MPGAEIGSRGHSGEQKRCRSYPSEAFSSVGNMNIIKVHYQASHNNHTNNSVIKLWDRPLFVIITSLLPSRETQGHPYLVSLMRDMIKPVIPGRTLLLVYILGVLMLLCTGNTPGQGTPCQVMGKGNKDRRGTVSACRRKGERTRLQKISVSVSVYIMYVIIQTQNFRNS